ncbi:MAG: hypothetical protein FD163_557 [Hyphomonadaceae bacterium]|nr:MAG: hypothetical protein FD128_1747 [Hyphomonadaceae bacterium]KAF0185889.1 MAG: hypothetical protein FD163_557 [Hyphomonadaceae bacterium]
MPKEFVPFACPDISRLAKSIKKHLDKSEKKPSHVEILNIFARESGYKNFQQMRASSDVTTSAKDNSFKENTIGAQNLQKLKRYLDDKARVKTLPSKQSLQLMIVWYIWGHIAAQISFTEIELNHLLNRYHTFGDAALLRRYMFELGLVSRSSNCQDYRKLSPTIPSEYSEIVKFAQKISKSAKS